MSNPKIYILIVNWNGLSDTLECLHSLASLHYSPYEVVVVDNDSHDDSVREIHKYFPDTQILETGHNFGYTGGNNVGIRYALANKADYVFLLNNDTRVDPAILSELIGFAQEHPKAGIVGPKQYFYYEPMVIAGMGSFIDWNKASITHSYRGYDESRNPTFNFSPRLVDFHDGCAVCIRREFIEAVGMLDERFYLGGFEDAEWGVRAVAHGYEVWNVPSAKVWHKISAAAGIGSPLTTYYMTRNALLFFHENGPEFPRWFKVAKLLFQNMRTIGAWTFKPKYRAEVFRYKSIANVMALRDSLWNRYGPMGPDVARYCHINP